MTCADVFTCIEIKLMMDSENKNKVKKGQVCDILIHDCENIIPSLAEEADIIRKL